MPSPSSSEEEASSSPLVQEHPSSTLMSPAAATPEKIDDVIELIITEDLDNRPIHKRCSILTVEESILSGAAFPFCFLMCLCSALQGCVRSFRPLYLFWRQW